MKRASLLGAVIALLAATPAQARLVASREDSGRLPTVSLGVTFANPKPPRVEVRAQPKDRVQIRREVLCVKETGSRFEDRKIRTKPPFSGRLALTMKKPVVCSFVVGVHYVEASEPDGSPKKGTIKLRLYR